MWFSLCGPEFNFLTLFLLYFILSWAALKFFILARLLFFLAFTHAFLSTLNTYVSHPFPVYFLHILQISSWAVPTQGSLCSFSWSGVCVCMGICMFVSHAHTHNNNKLLFLYYFIILCKLLPFVVLNTVAILSWFAWVVAKILIKFHEDKDLVSFCLLCFSST